MLMVHHAGRLKNGFQSQRKEVCDYHSKMNSHTFKECFLQLLNSVEISVITENNASYHLVQVSKCLSLLN